MTGVRSPVTKFRGFLIVRDARGVPLFDDPENAPEEMKALLSDDDIRLMDRATVARLGLTHRLEN